MSERDQLVRPRSKMQKITTFLTYNDQAKQAANFYTSVFKDARIVSTTPGPDGTVMGLELEIAGQRFFLLNGGPTFKFSHGISLFVSCETQAEIDELWTKLTAGGGEEDQCGWLRDRFGVSWQIVPTVLMRLLQDPDSARAGRAMQAMLKMRKLDIAGLELAAAG